MSKDSQQALLKTPENSLLSDIIDLPGKEPVWIFSDLWQEQTPAMFTGDGGTGKTHFALQMGYAIASGTDIAGTPFRCPQPRDFVFFTQEDEQEHIRTTILTQNPALKSQPDVASRIRIVSTAIQGETLLFTSLKNRKYIESNIPEYGVAGFDAFGTFIVGNEISNSEMAKEMNCVREISKARNASILLLHHRPKANLQNGQQHSYRGATSISQPIRFHIMFDGHGKGVKLSFEKVSRGLGPESLLLFFDDERHIFVPAEEDRYVKVFRSGEGPISTSEVMQRLGLDSKDELERKRTLNNLKTRATKPNSPLERVTEGKKHQDATWQLRCK